jgi:hypothetical protein
MVKVKINIGEFIPAVEKFLKRFKKEATEQWVDINLKGGELCFSVKSENDILKECLNVEISDSDLLLRERVDNVKKLLKHLKNWKKYGIEVVYLQIKGGAWDITIE